MRAAEDLAGFVEGDGAVQRVDADDGIAEETGVGRARAELVDDAVDHVPAELQRFFLRADADSVESMDGEAELLLGDRAPGGGAIGPEFAIGTDDPPAAGLR